LYLCRSTTYAEERNEISESIHTLIDTYEAEYDSASIQIDQIEKMVQENYTSPDFSVSSLADHFHVSIAYMSYLFKKHYKVNFIDYLWKLRMNKAKEMLSTTDTILMRSVSLSVTSTLPVSGEGSNRRRGRHRHSLERQTKVNRDL